MTVEEIRVQYPVLDRLAYLNAGSAGPLARTAFEAAAEEHRRDLEEGRGGTRYVERVMAMRARVRALLAAEIGVAPERLALTRATTDGCNVVVNGLDLAPGDEIVTTDSEHFGLLGALAASPARVVVAAPDAEAIVAAVGPRTRLIALSHVLWTTGRVLPLLDLKRRTGLPLLVDGAQSVGAIPVEAEPFDFYTVSCQKWLCCPDVSGALYVRDPDSLSVRCPSYFSQSAHDADGSFMPREGSDRFDTGWIAPGILAGIEAALAVHPAWRFERAREARQRCVEVLAGRGLDVIVEQDQATLVAFRPEGDSKDVIAAAYARGVIIRDLPKTGLVRASCGYWTSNDDLERLADAVAPR